MSSRFAALFTILSACLYLSADAQAPDIEIVALTGQQVPGATPGVTFCDFSFRGPTLNSSGQTTFVAESASLCRFNDDRGIYSSGSGSGSLAELAREGTQVPNASAGVVFSDFESGFNVLNDSGQSAFVADLRGTGVGNSNNSGVYGSRFGRLEQIARTGDQAPGVTPGVVFTRFGGWLAINASGQTAFMADLTGGFPNSGIFSEGSGTLAMVAHTGDEVPDSDPDISFGSFSFPSINASGKTAFRASLSGPGINDSGIYSDRHGELEQIAQTGGQVPNATSGTVFSSIGHNPTINASGEIVFVASLSGESINLNNSRGIYSDRSGTLTEVVRAGDHAPNADPGVVFSSAGFGFPAHNASGQIAFRSNLLGAGVDATNNAAIYIGGSATLTQIAREGNQAPDADPGVLLGDLWEEPLLNALGQTAFETILTGKDVRDWNDVGIYATDIDGDLVEIIREGKQIDVNEDPLITDLRTVRTLSLFSSISDGGGHRSGFNDKGQIAFVARFTDDSEGIFLSNLVAVPEPSNLAFLVFAAIGLLKFRRDISQFRTC